MFKTIRVPTEKEIDLLPCEAQTAFAARCARRVQPLLKHYWPEAPEKHIEAIEKKITAAESSQPCSNSKLCAEAFSAASAAVDYARTARDASALAADYAAYAAAYICVSTVNVVAVTVFAAEAAGLGGVVEAIWRDYSLLKAACESEKWDDEHPVPPEIFGPMWPDGAPEGWPTV